jgi:SET domain-containing protein
MTISTADVEVRDSEIQGRGLYALRDFKVGDVVLRWDLNHTISTRDLSNMLVEERRYTHPLDEDRAIIVQPPERFVNHSCDNNTEVRDFCDVAIKTIRVGDEITSDYGTDGSGVEFDCLCGSENCRGRIGS